MTLHLTNARIPGERGLLGNLINLMVDDGMIVGLDFVGHTSAITLPTTTRMERTVSGEDQIIDLGGRWVVPGLWDNHVHMSQWAMRRRRLDLAGVTSVDELARQAGAAISSASTVDGSGAGSAVVGFGWRPAHVSGSFSREALDAVTGDRPVYLFSTDLHSAWLNSAGFSAMGITPTATGVLVEDTCFRVQAAVSRVDDAVLDEWVDEAAREAARRGVVGIVDYEMAWNAGDWRRRIGRGCDALRVEASVYPHHLDQASEAGLRTGDAVASTQGLLEVGSLKVITDGSLGSQTARCFEPYPGATGPGARGVLNWPLPDLASVMGRAWAAGLSSAVHAIGDEAAAIALDAFEAVECEGSIEHAQLMRPDDIRRMAECRVIASVQPSHLLDDRDTAHRLWVGRTDQAFAFGQMRDAGVRMAFGSDAPVSSLDPWRSIVAAVTRTGDEREAWNARECLSREDALAASVRTHIAVGQRADLAILDLDPLECSETELATMSVAATFVGGRATHLALD